MDLFASMRVFVAVVEAGGFARAANRLDLSRAMVSRHLVYLENEVGTRLLNRTTRRIGLTESGQAYYHRCLQILAEVEDAAQAVSNLTTKPAGTLKITAPVSFGILHLAPLLTGYGELYPEVRLDVHLNDRHVDLIEEGYDLAVRIGALSESGLIARKLVTDRGVVCAAPAYLARHGTPLTPADLAQHACLTYSYTSPGEEWRFHGPQGDCRVRVAGGLRANNGDLLRLAALAGMGVIWQPLFIVSGDLRAGRLVEVLAEYRSRDLGIYVVYPSRTHLSAKVRTFVDFLASRLGPEPPWAAP